jgi:hypothetical protein
MNTKVFREKFKGQAMFSVFEVDDSGKKKSEKPVLNMGIKKAELVMKHEEEFREYVRLYGDSISEENDL